MSQDPVFWTTEKLKEQIQDPQLWNSYSYSRGNPIMYKDQDGKFMDDWNKSSFSFTGSAANYFNENIGNPAREFASTVANFTAASDFKSAYDALFGRDLITNATLSNEERFLSAVAIIPYVPGTLGRTGQEGKIAKYADSLASKIVNNDHTFEKHVVNEKQWGDIQTKGQFNNFLKSIIKNPSDYYKGGGKELFWDNKTKTIIINNPVNPTAFKPANGKNYFKDEVKNLRRNQK